MVYLEFRLNRQLHILMGKTIFVRLITIYLHACNFAIIISTQKKVLTKDNR